MGVSITHDAQDKIFGCKRVYLVCVYIWTISILIMLPDVVGAFGSFTLSRSQDVCDFGCPWEGCFNLFPAISIVNNILFMSIFHIIIVTNLYLNRKGVSGGEESKYRLVVKSISRTVSFMVGFYIVGLIPAVSFNLGQWPPKSTVSLYM